MLRLTVITYVPGIIPGIVVHLPAEVGDALLETWKQEDTMTHYVEELRWSESTVELSQPQERREVALPESPTCDQYLWSKLADPGEPPRDEPVTPIEDCPSDMPVTPIEDCPTFPDVLLPFLQDLKITPENANEIATQTYNENVFPECVDLTHQKHVIHELKVLEYDGEVRYIKTLYDPQVGDFYDSAMIRPSKDGLGDSALFWFLCDRNYEDFWDILMGSEPPAPGCRFSYFPKRT